MRKQTKKVLSWILSAAMTLGLATGSGFAAQKASAADSDETEYVKTEYTAAELTFTYTEVAAVSPDASDAASDTAASDTAAYFTGEETASITASGVYTKDVYKGMTTGWTGNIGWIKNPSAGYEISDVKLVLTTADGDIEFALNGGEGVWNEKEESYNFDFPNIWNANNFPITSIDGSAQIVIDNDAHALALQVAPASEEAEATGTPEATTPATGGAVTGDAVTGDATTEPATSDEPDASETPVESTEPVEEPDGIKANLYNSVDWETIGTTYMTGDGTYTVTLDYDEPTAVAEYLAVRFEELDDAFENDKELGTFSNYIEFSDVKISFDGVEVENPEWSYGGDGDARIQFRNVWGNYAPEAYDNITAKKIEVTFTISGMEEYEEIPEASLYNSVDWKNFASVKIPGDGTYSLELNYEDATAVAEYLAVRIEKFDEFFENDEETGTSSKYIKFSDVKIAFDGTEVENPEWSYGGDGDCRIQFRNVWGNYAPEAYENITAKKIKVTFTIEGIQEAYDAKEAEEAAKDVWNQEGVHAYVYYQTAAWDCRNDYSAALNGKAPEEVDAFAEYSYRYIKAGGADVSKEADVTDVLIKEDGTYTVKIAGIDLSGADYFNQLGISTDLAVPEDEQKAGEDAADEGKDFDWSVSVSDVTVKIDGETVPEGLDKCVLPHNAESPYYLFTAANIWADNEKIPYNKGTDHLEVVPEDSIEITFTIKGIPTAGPEASATPEASSTPGASAAPTQTATPGTSATPAATATVAPVATATPDTVLVKEGTTVSVGNFKYKVTKAATAKTAGTVKLAGLTKKGKKAKKLTLPASIKKGSAKLSVTALGGSAFKGAKATSITIKSKKVTKLPSKVFANCKKLKTLTLAAKLKSVNKKAFKGCKKTIKIKGTSKKANKKVIKKVYKKTK